MNIQSDHLLPAPVGKDFFILLCCYYCYDFGFLTVSSIERIVQAASVAAFNAFILTNNGYQTKDVLLLPVPDTISTPTYIVSSVPALLLLSKYIKKYNVLFLVY